MSTSGLVIYSYKSGSHGMLAPLVWEGVHFSGGTILVGEIPQMVAAAGRMKVITMGFLSGP